MYELRRSDGYIPFCLTFYSVFFYDFSVDTSLYSLRPYELLRGSLYACLCNAKNIRKPVGIFFVKLNPFTIMLSVPMSEGSLIISTFIFLCMWKLEVKNLTYTTGLDMAVSFLDVSFYWLRFEFSIYTSTVCFWDIAKHKKICVALEYIFSFAFTEDNLCLGKIQIAISFNLQTNTLGWSSPLFHCPAWVVSVDVINL